MTLTATIKKGVLLIAAGTALAACDATQIVGGPLDIGAAQTNNLLSHGGFERGFGEWQACSDPSLLSLETNDLDTASTAILEPGGCLFQTQRATANDNMVLNCTARKESTDWASVTFGYLDSNFEPLKTVEEPIPDTIFTNVSASLRAPANTAYVEVLIYTEDGAEVDDCELINTAESQPFELLLNSHFDEDLASWQSCGQGTTAAMDGVATITNSCLSQKFTASAGLELQLTCDGTKIGDEHAAVALGFLDSDSEAIEMVETPISTEDGLFPTVALTAPAGTRFLQAMVYTVGEVNLNSCSLHFPSAE